MEFVPLRRGPLLAHNLPSSPVMARSYAARSALVLPLLLVGCASSAPEDEPSPAAAELVQDQRATSRITVLPIEGAAPGVPLTFEVPEHAVGFTVVVESDAPNAHVGVQMLLDPSGAEVFHEFTPVGGTTPTAHGGGVAAALVPQSDAAEATPTAGRWTVVLAAFDGITFMPTTAPLRASVYVQTTSDGAFHGGTLDLHVFVPDGLVVQDPLPAHAITADDAASDECIKARIDGFYDALSSMVGVDRGAVTFHSLPATFARLTSEEAFREALRQTGVLEDGFGLNFVLTNLLEVGPGQSAWGRAGAIGAPGQRNGTAASGVMLSIAPEFPAYGDALTMFHEAGHYFGLNHTSELMGGDFDALADTPQCTTISHEKFAHCPDARDVMFPLYFAASNGGEDVYLTPGQARVVRGSPLYRAYVD
jgi:hypothetical protein